MFLSAERSCTFIREQSSVSLHSFQLLSAIFLLLFLLCLETFKFEWKSCAVVWYVLLPIIIISQVDIRIPGLLSTRTVLLGFSNLLISIFQANTRSPTVEYWSTRLIFSRSSCFSAESRYFPLKLLLWSTSASFPASSWLRCVIRIYDSKRKHKELRTLRFASMNTNDGRDGFVTLRGKREQRERVRWSTSASEKWAKRFPRR